MALTGLEIYKLLPKTNCKKCGFPTCLAFAMKLAAKQAELSACPDVSEEAKAALDAAAAPPIRLVTIASDGHKIEVGNETVLFRHDKTFYYPPGLMVRVKDTAPLAQVEEMAAQVETYAVERVGMELGFHGLAIENASGDGATFAQYVEAVRARCKKPLILMSDKAEAMAAALARTGGTTPLLYAATQDNWSTLTELARKHKCPLAIRTDRDLSALANLAEQVKGAGVQDLVLDPGVRGLNDSLTVLTQLRRLALKKNFRPLGYPIITFPGQGADSQEQEVVLASQHIAKYGGFIVLDHLNPTIAYPLLTLRLNIYTDPQKPIQVEPGLREINDPKPESPLMVTTNFSLTYFSVSGEVEGSGFPGWLLIADSEGLSVLTAWAAGKFDAEKIAKSVKTFGVADRISHRQIIIPGQVATISGELEEELPGWKILVGPREAVDLPNYLKLWKPD